MNGCLLSALALLALPSGALAQSLPVANFSFEDPVASSGGFSAEDPPGWTTVAGSGERGVFHPTIGTWGYVASLGNQLLYTNGPTLQHTLSTNAQANTTYTLRVDVIARPGYTPTYTIELYAGQTLLRRDDNTLHPPSGGYLTSVLAYAVGPADPVIGQPLRIRLGGTVQTNFDNVRVTTGAGCYANCDDSTQTPVLNVNDFVCFQTRFAGGDPWANCDGSSQVPLLNVNDFVCFQTRFAGGCP